MAGLVVCGVVVVFFGITVALPVILYHRREMFRLRGNNQRELQRLNERVDSVERHCARLDEQVAAAHLLLADEQRRLDRKLAQVVDDPNVPARDDPAGDENSTTPRARQRDKA